MASSFAEKLRKKYHNSISEVPPPVAQEEWKKEDVEKARRALEEVQQEIDELEGKTPEDSREKRKIERRLQVLYEQAQVVSYVALTGEEKQEVHEHRADLEAQADAQRW